jgi:glutathione synthase
MKIGFLMDPPAHIKPRTDSTLALMLAAQEADAALFFFTPDDLFLKDGKTCANLRAIRVSKDENNWHTADAPKVTALAELDTVMMRKDPPVDKRFIHTCYLLEMAKREGVRVVNDPAALIAWNEKLLAARFPEFCPPYVVASDAETLRAFWREHGAVIMKPLDAMGGAGVFMVEKDSVNFDVIRETLTQNGTYPVIAQKFLPEIAQGDKRIIVINGKPFGHALVRLPKAGSIRGNLVHGGGHEVRALSPKEREIAETVGAVLGNEGILFAGLDVIGDRLIEVNITSPTGLRQLSQATGDDLGAAVMRAVMG